MTTLQSLIVITLFIGIGAVTASKDFNSALVIITLVAGLIAAFVIYNSLYEKEAS